MDNLEFPPGFEDMLQFSLFDALSGRRSRRFFLGAEIPDGVFAFKSKYNPMPLSKLETLLLVLASGGNTGWHHMIHRGKLYAPHLSNYSGAAGGRVFPSAAGFETSKTFFTNDDGVYLLDVRDAPALTNKNNDGSIEIKDLLKAHENQIIKLQETRLDIPAQPPYVEEHNTWVFNKPGTLVVIPVGDLSMHVLLGICYMLQNGLVLRDDIHQCSIPGIEKFKSIVDVNNYWNITFLEQWSLSELSVELGCSCYAGVLMLQAMGLGGWMLNGVDPFSVLGASQSDGVMGLGFQYEEDNDWPYPNPTGLTNFMQGYCPPHFDNMHAAVEALCQRKFGPGGPFHANTAGPWKDSEKVRSAALPHSEAFKACVAHQAQYIYDTFGKFPGTVPSMFVIMYLQAHHLDLDFYNHFYDPGAYLKSHADHMSKWHVK